MIPILFAFLMIDPVTVDRIAVLIGQHVIKTSDIDREVRIIQFINGEPLDLSARRRREAANRLIDQMVIRQELETGGYTEAKPEQAQQMLAEIRKQRYPTDAAYHAALNRYGITEERLLRQLTWQMTVLDFIEQRFRPGALVTADEIDAFLKKQKPGMTRQQAEDLLAGQKVNEQFYFWLGQQRRQARPRYITEALE
jgi:hypothetical protein